MKLGRAVDAYIDDMRSQGRIVAYVESSQNRSGGAVMGAQLKPFCDGQRFIIEAGRP